MAIDRKLLEILCCPATHVPVQRLASSKLQAVNREIGAGGVHFADGSPVADELAEALVTDNGTTIYAVEDGIPVMLEERGIPVVQFDGIPPLP